MLKKSIVAVSIAAVAALAAPDNQYEVSGVIGAIGDPSGNDLKTALIYGARVGTRVFDNKIVEFAYDRVSGMKYDDKVVADTKTDLNRYAINGILEHEDYKVLVPYLLAGLGYEDWTKERGGIDSGMMFNWGVGMRWALAKYFHIKAEAKHAINFSGFSTVSGTLNAVIPFGYPAPAPAPKVVEVIEEVVIVEELDSDGDGVFDKYDECPGTPKGFKVDDKGCPLSYDFRVQFDFNKAVIKPEYQKEVQNFASFLEKNPYNVMLKGYTDNVGNDAYNLKLSDRRSKAVEAELERLGVEPKRVEAKGYGKANPIATNDTAEGRYQNRRVTAELEIPKQ